MYFLTSIIKFISGIKSRICPFCDNAVLYRPILTPLFCVVFSDDDAITRCTEIADLSARSFCTAWMPHFNRKLAKLALNGTNPGLSQIRFQYILARGAKMY